MTAAFRPGPARFGVGDTVSANRALRQDGTFPDASVAVGEVLVPQGSCGQVLDIGVYLGEHIVYAVAFDGGRLVGCLDRELDLVAADEPPDRPTDEPTEGPTDQPTDQPIRSRSPGGSPGGGEAP